MSKYEDVDKALFRWFCEVQAESIPVSSPMLQAKARSIGHLFKHKGFNPLNGCIQRFKDRRGISCKVISGVSGEVDDASIQAWFRIHFETMLSAYTSKDIYNADEAGLCYNMLPDRTHAMRGEPCCGRKISKEHVTVLFCANMGGSKKRHLFIIGKLKQFRCLKKRECLPVVYTANGKAWMTQEFFASWLKF